MCAAHVWNLVQLLCSEYLLNHTHPLPETGLSGGAAFLDKGVVFLGDEVVSYKEQQAVPELPEVRKRSYPGEHLSHHTLRGRGQQGGEQLLVELDSQLTQFSEVNNLE